jgi:hypothetical protein
MWVSVSGADDARINRATAWPTVPKPRSATFTRSLYGRVQTQVRLMTRRGVASFVPETAGLGADQACARAPAAFTAGRSGPASACDAVAP